MWEVEVFKLGCVFFFSKENQHFLQEMGLTRSQRMHLLKNYKNRDAKWNFGGTI